MIVLRKAEWFPLAFSTIFNSELSFYTSCSMKVRVSNLSHETAIRGIHTFSKGISAKWMQWLEFTLNLLNQISVLLTVIQLTYPLSDYCLQFAVNTMCGIMYFWGFFLHVLCASFLNSVLSLFNLFFQHLKENETSLKDWLILFF